MKRIDCIIRPQSLDVVKDRLAGVGVQGITVMEVRGFGRQKGHSEVYRGREYSVDLLPKLLVTVVASDERVPDILNAVVEGARTGKFGDGKILVTPLDEVIRIRTGNAGRMPFEVVDRSEMAGTRLGESSPDFENRTFKEVDVAANRQQGGYLAEFLLGFTMVAAGLVTLSIASRVFGVLIAIAGLALLTHASLAFRRIKALEFRNE